MPEAIQGDIFEHALAKDHDLVVVFGHIGMNLLHSYFRQFRRSVPGLEGQQDPFAEFANQARRFGDGCWVWFVAQAENHGMDDATLERTFAELTRFAREHGVRKVLTNGTADIDHGRDTLANRESDDRRAHLIWNMARTWEAEEDVAVSLISLNDVFVRNVPKHN